MLYTKTKNNRAIRSSEIPEVSLAELRTFVTDGCNSGQRLLSLFAGRDPFRLYAILADDSSAELYLTSSSLEGVGSYPSITEETPSAHMFERELFEETGIVPRRHPWLKPVRYGIHRYDQKQVMEKYPFFSMDGEEVHEVAVGPIHAGVIEPGHFRFMCTGEWVHHLEIQLGYQHRGVMELFRRGSAKPMPQLAESIAGDTVIGYVLSYCNALEALAGCSVSRRAQAIRAVALEMERAAIHTGGLGAISGDIAYQPGNAVFGANRTTIINSLLAICGSRFGRGLVRPGGVVFDIDSDTAARVKANLLGAYENIKNMSEELLSSAMVLSRLQLTGVVSREDALAIGLTGFAARASGLAIDARVDHPWGTYSEIPVRKITQESGDAFARSYLRYQEIGESIDYVVKLLDNLPEGEIAGEMGKPAPDSFVVSMAEGWRGPVITVMFTGGDGRVKTHRIYDPSFNNWYGLALSLRREGISDFPLCNKSFDLSYCGNDL